KSGPIMIAEGNSVTYGFTITNTSPASTDPVTITSVVDNVLGDLTAAANAAWVAQGNSGPIILAPGDAFTFSFTTTTALNAGTVLNTVSVSGHDDENTPATANDTATVIVTDVVPTIAVAKSGPTSVPEGSTVTYAFTITNTSSASTDPVTITSVIDDVLGNLTSAANAAWVAQGHATPIILVPDASFTFNFTTLTAQDAGTLTNVVTVSGHDDENNPASTSDNATVIVTNVAPSITVAKSAPVTVAEGNTATYSFTITNTSPASTDPVTITSVVDNV